MLTDTFIRVTFPNELNERDERLVSLIVTESIADYMVLSEDSNLVEAVVYETEQGHTMEFPATLTLVILMLKRFSKVYLNFSRILN